MLMLGAGLPFLQLQWLQLCSYKVQVHVPVQVLIQLWSFCDCKIPLALVVGVVLHSAWFSIGDAVLEVLPVELDKGQQNDSIGT